MLNAEHFVVSFARSVELLRTRPDAVEEHKAALRALVGLCKLGPARLCCEDGSISAFNKSVPMSLPGLAGLAVQLRDHGVSEIWIKQAPAPAELLGLLRGLAAAPSHGASWAPKETVRVVFQPGSGQEIEEPKTDRSAAVVASATEEGPEASGALRPTVEEHVVQNDGIMTEDKMMVGLDSLFDSGQAPTLEEALAQLESQPYEGNVLSQASAVVAQIPVVLERDDVKEAVSAMSKVIYLETDAPEGSPRRGYEIAIRKMLSPSAIEAAARAAVMDPDTAAMAIRVLKRAGESGAAVVVERIEEAQDSTESRAYLAALSEFPEHAESFVRLLEHRQAFVVDGVAKLLGELGVDSAVEVLVTRLQDSNPKVREAAASALAQMGTPIAIEQLRQALSSSDDGVQGAAVRAIGGRKSGVLAMPLVNLLEEKNLKPERLLDCYRALGRIGSPAAMQALIRAAQPGGRLVARKSTERRLAALEGLKAVNLPPAYQGRWRG